MGSKEEEYKGHFVSRHPRFGYLPESDRYLSSRVAPTYTCNVIGTGIIGQEHMRVTMLEGRATIHGIYDPNPLSIKQAQQIFDDICLGNELIIYDSFEEACHDPEVDALLLCTPNFTHIEVVKEAMKSGKHILLEKPMATTVTDAWEITRLAKHYEAVFQIGLQYRYKAIYAEAIHEALERKTIGNVKKISLLEHRVPFLDKVGQWNKFSKYSGGSLVEKCCHYFDLMNLFAQSKPKHVYATGSQAINFVAFEYNQEKSDIIDNAFVTIVYENGVQASFDLCMFAPMFQEEMIICGHEGRLKATESKVFLPVPQIQNSLEVIRDRGRPSKLITPCYPAEIEESGHGGATYYEHIYFIDNIEGKQTTTATVEEGFWSVVIGVAAEESVKTGNVVYIEEMLSRQGPENI